MRIVWAAGAASACMQGGPSGVRKSMQSACGSTVTAFFLFRDSEARVVQTGACDAQL